MTKEEYIKSFCAEYCGYCRLPKPEKCTWKEIATKSWDAAINESQKEHGDKNN